MTDKINIKINGRKISCDNGKSILEIAQENKIFIPALCKHPDFRPKADCRLCLVEIKGKTGLFSSCSTPAEDNMEISTDTEEIRTSRALNLRLLFGEHMKSCNECMRKYDCSLLRIEKACKPREEFDERKNLGKVYKIANAIEFDTEKCIDCGNCVDACSELQKINAISFRGKGSDREVAPVSEKNIHCILCGQCTSHCPASSAREQTHWEKVEELIKDKSKIVIAQFAPAVRASISEEFGMEPGEIVSGQIVAGLKKLGFDFVFDVSSGADITTIIEAKELLERIKLKEKMPMFTSCCPSWVLYCEFYHPELLPHLTTSRSPHIHLGGVLKTYWAEKMKINPENLVVVSIMPCTSKKYEASRPELKIGGLNPVDYVLTVREFGFMLKKNKINLPRLKGIPADSPAGETGSGDLYGESGGVMEDALRAADFFATGEKRELDIDLSKIRTLEGVKEAIVDVAGKKLRIAVVNGIGNVEPVLKHLKDYDYIEVMSCPGGCISGGGQPIPTTPEIRKKRVDALSKLYEKNQVRKAYDNKEIMEIVSGIESEEKSDSIFYTKFRKRNDY